MPSFCRFTVGTPGASAVHMRYISRGDAVREGIEGAFFRNLPEAIQREERYRELRPLLESYAWAREESENATHERRGGRGLCRSHYRCVLSFEREISTPAIKRMTEEWLREAFPTAMVACFVHRNTEHVHVHLWFDARGIDGKKLDFSPKAWGRIGTNWNRIYIREMAREDRLATKLAETDLARGKGAYAQTGASRRSVRTSTGVASAKADRSHLEASEQALGTCLENRSRAVRATRELRGVLEGMGRPPGSRDRDGREDR